MLEADIDRENLILFPYGVLTTNNNQATVLRTSPEKTHTVPAEVIEWLDALSFAPSFDALTTYVQSMKKSEKLFNLIIDRLLAQKAIIPVFSDGSFEDIMLCLGDVTPQFNKAFITMDSPIMYENQPTVSFLTDNIEYNILDFTKNLLTEYSDSMTFGDRFTASIIVMPEHTRDSFLFPTANEKHIRLLNRVIYDLQVLVRNKIIYFSR